MATMNVSLPAPMKAWVEERSADGRYANSSDYVRDLIRKDQERAEGSAEIQALITQVRRTIT
jgi:antitoxin ParD1/3/4